MFIRRRSRLRSTQRKQLYFRSCSLRCSPVVASFQLTERKHGKNRLHLDLRTQDLDAEVRRVVGIGASLLTSQPLQEYGWRWHILGDPDGNEFCVIQPPDSYRPVGTGPA